MGCVELVKSLFNDEDSSVILSIPLRDDFEDFIAWHYDKHGVFSLLTKSAEIMQLIAMGLVQVALLKFQQWTLLFHGRRYGRCNALIKSNTLCGGLHITVCLYE